MISHGDFSLQSDTFASFTTVLSGTTLTGCDYSLMTCFHTPEKAAFYRRIESAFLFPRTPSRRESAFARPSWKQRLPFVSHSLHAPEGTAQTRIMTYWPSLLALWLSPWRHEYHLRSTQQCTNASPISGTGPLPNFNYQSQLPGSNVNPTETQLPGYHHHT